MFYSVGTDKVFFFFQIKRMKQLEQEKGNLLKGLEMVEQAQEWYHKQVVVVEEKQKYIGQTSYNVSAHLQREREREREERRGGFLSLSIYQNILYRKKTEKHDFDLYNYIPHFRIII